MPQRGSYPVLPCLHYHPQTAPHPRLNMPPTRSFLHISSLSHPHLLPQVMFEFKCKKPTHMRGSPSNVHAYA
ncbi:hypothetical protein PIB30_108137, partial [Stylosanthes scabra]|nr:hypothetical protein [Stylosanthes scabra]